VRPPAARKAPQRGVSDTTLSFQLSLSAFSFERGRAAEG
jgi:hypothetical protein